MKTRQTKVETIFGTVTIGGDYVIVNAEVKQLVDSAWNFAYNSLWAMTILSTKEIETVKERIHEFLNSAKSPRQEFLSFCQRILLARQRLNTKARYAALPSIWLDENNKDGYGGTKPVLEEIMSIRESLPQCREDIQAMAEAVLEFSDIPSLQNYQYWRQYFIKKQNRALLSLFQVTAIQQLYN